MHQLIFCFLRYILHRIVYKMYIWNNETVESESNAKWFCVMWMKGNQNSKNSKKIRQVAQFNWVVAVLLLIHP